MKTAIHFFRTLSWPIALHAGQWFLTIIGAIAVISWILYAPWYARVLAVLFLSGAWYSFYQLEWNWRTRRTMGRET